MSKATDQPTGIHERTQVYDSYKYIAARDPSDSYTLCLFSLYYYSICESPRPFIFSNGSIIPGMPVCKDRRRAPHLCFSGIDLGALVPVLP